MKAWEMIKELTEHTEKKFRSDIPCGDYYLASANNWNGERYSAEIERVDMDDVPIKPFWGLDFEWYEVIEPVDYTTAYNDCLENSGDDTLIRYKNELTPHIFIVGMNGVVSVHVNKPYGNIDKVNNLWIKE